MHIIIASLTLKKISLQLKENKINHEDMDSYTVVSFPGLNWKETKFAIYVLRAIHIKPCSYFSFNNRKLIYIFYNIYKSLPAAFIKNIYI